MADFSFKKISKGELKGWLRADLIDSLPPLFFQDPVLAVQKIEGQSDQGVEIEVGCRLQPSPGEKGFRQKGQDKGMGRDLKYPPASLEGQKGMVHRLPVTEKRALPVPGPLGWMERERRGFVKESYYLSEAIGSGTSLMESSRF